MKRVLIALFCAGLITGYSSIASADTLQFYQSWTGNQWISTNSSLPQFWIRFDFPNAGPDSSYPNGRFEYDAYLGNLLSFTITVQGKDDDSDKPIDFFLDFNSNHSSWYQSNQSDRGKIAGYNVAKKNPFTLVLDIKSSDLIYNGLDVGNLKYVTPATFLDKQEFYLGIGCHFRLTGVDVDIRVRNPVPEPSAVLLLGTAVIALAVGTWRRRT